jgi:hypothetical protein
MDDLLLNSNSTLVIGKYSEKRLSISNKIANKIVSLNNIETIYKEIDEKNMSTLLENQKKNSKPVLLHLNILRISEILDNLKLIIYNARHLNIFIVMAINEQVHLKPEIRVNMDLVITCKETEYYIIKKIYCYFGVIETIKKFENLIKNIDENVILCLNKNKINTYNLASLK